MKGKHTGIILLAFTMIIVMCLIMMTGCTRNVKDEPYTIEYGSRSYDGIYTGVMVDGVPEGSGQFKCGEIDGKDYLVYEGDWEAGKFKGDGVLATDNYSFSSNAEEVGVYFEGTGSFAGEVVDGIPNGKGSFVYGEEGSDDYLIYDGDWKDGKFNGDGYLTTSYYSTTGTIYDDQKVNLYGKFKGTCVDGLPNGEGNFIVTSKDKELHLEYNGNWSEGLWDGYGELTFSDDAFYDLIGSYKKGKYDPTVAEMIKSLGTMSTSCPYDLSDKAYDFINTNEKIFVDPDKETIDKLGTKDLNIGKFKKNPKSYKPGLTEVDWLYVQQAIEEKVGNHTVTFILAYDHNWNYYWLECLWGSDAFVEGSEIRAIFMPLGYSTYETVSGGNQWAISGVVVY